MFDFFKKKPVSHAEEYFPAVQSYVKKTIEAEENKPHFSLRSSAGSGVRYSSRGTADSDVRYSRVLTADPDVRYSRRQTAGQPELPLELENYYMQAMGLPVKAGFTAKVIEHINRKDLRDSAVYRAANIDRRLFSKIMSDRSYQPSKDTAIAIAIGLRLNLQEADDLLSSAGYTLSHSSRRDAAIEYFFHVEIYNLTDINIVLDRLGEKIIGR